MRTLRHISMCMLVAAAALAQQAPLDRIVAVVNRDVVLESEVLDAARWQRFTEAREPGAITQEEREAALERMIDQRLVEQQTAATNYQPATDAEIEARVTKLRQQLGSGRGGEGWRALLGRYGLTEDAVRDRVSAEVNLLRFVQLKLRPSVYVDRREVRAYYEEKYLPEMRRQNAEPPPLSQVAADIENILAEEQMNKLFEVWLQGVRAQSVIKRVEPQAAGTN